MDSPLKKHEQTYANLCALLASGKYLPGSKLPNERALALDLGVAVMTLRKALDRLEEEGHLHRRPYHGTTVMATKAPAAPRLKERKPCVGLVVPQELSAISHPVYGRFLNGLEGVLSARRAHIKMVVSNPAQENTEEYLLNVIQQERVDGWVIPSEISPQVRSALKRIPAPKVLMHFPDDALSPHFFETDCRSLGIKIGRHLLEEGYRRVLVLSHPVHSFIRQQLVTALEEILSQQGDATLWRHSLPQGGAADGARMCRRLLECGEKFDAVVCDDDDAALGVVQALKERGLTPPDIGIIGAGDFPLASLMSPALTTIFYPYYQVGREIAALLMDLIQQHPVEPAHRMFASRLIVRPSSQKSLCFPRDAVA